MFPMHSQPPKSPLSEGLLKLRAGRSSILGNHKGCPYIGSIPVGVGFLNPLGEGTSPLRQELTGELWMRLT